MSEEENISVEEQIAPNAVAEATESEVATERQETAEERRKRNDAEYNWAEARRKMQELDRRNHELAQELSSIKKQSQPEAVDDEIDRLGDDEIVSKSQAKKLVAKMAREIANDLIRQKDASTVEDRIKSKFPDFDDVVSQENIETLKQTRPALASSLAHNPDPYAQAVAVYEALKMVNPVVKKNPEKERAIANSQKPLSVNAVSKQSPIGNAYLFENGLTPELKSQLYKEMIEAAKRA